MSYEGLSDVRDFTAVIGNLLQEPSLLDDIDKPLEKEDFSPSKFHELVFSAIYNLHQGCEVLDEFAIDSYLCNYPAQYKIFQENNGLDYIVSTKTLSSVENYDYHYHRIKKFSLLRYYESKGLDTRPIYDPSLRGEEEEKEKEKFDSYTEQSIIEKVEATFVINPGMKYTTNTLSTNIQAGEGMKDLVRGYMEIPDVGLPLGNMALNTIARGARLGCVYMRSARQGGGKSRMLAEDICKFSVPYIYDETKKTWVYTGMSEPSLYITTEMTEDEIQTLFIAAVSKVNEEHILYGEYEDGELERVNKAIEYIEASPLYISHIPDFSISDIVGIIKKYNRELLVCYFAFDYIHTSLRLMAEVSNRTKMGLKEHQLLLVFITELKAIAQKLDVFIFTASQLNGEAEQAQYKDQNLLAGAKALANKLDVGIISMRPNKKEYTKIEPIARKISLQKVGQPIPNMAHWVYKVRRGRITRIIVWTKINFGTMTEEALFVTDYDFNLINIDFTKIEQVEKKIQENSVLISQVKDESVQEDDEDEPSSEDY